MRRLRAKLGPEHEQLIGTVRNVGYKFVRPMRGVLGTAQTSTDESDDAEEDAPASSPRSTPATPVPRSTGSWDDARVVRPAAWARGV